MVFIAAAQGYSLKEQVLAGEASPDDNKIIPKRFITANIARDYLLEHGVLTANSLRHFPDLDAVATNGQLLSVLGSLYTALVY
jgi:hypothetical protein